MTHGIVLDGLLVAAIVLYVPIGALRGGLREAILGGSILLGAAFAVTRPGSWSEELASVADLTPGDASFAVALACLAGPVLLLGVGGGALCDRRVPSWRGRILGAGIGVINATVLITFVLIAYEDLGRGETRSTAVADSYLARALTEHVDLVLLAAVGIASLAILAGHLTNRIIGVAYDTDLEPTLTWLQSTQRPPRTVRIPAEADAGKVEPGARGVESHSPPEVFGGTRTVYAKRAPKDSATHDRDGWADRPWAEDDLPSKDGGVTSNGGSNQDASLAELRRLLRIGPDPEQREPSHAWPFTGPPASGLPPSRSEPSAQSMGDLRVGDPSPGRCHRCDTNLPDPTLPCPFCDDRR